MTFAKLKNKFTIESYQLGDEVISHIWDRLRYCRTTGTSNLLEVLPERYRNKFVVLSMNCIDNIPPHTDTVITCAINFYLNPGNYTTFFWDIKNKNIDKTFQLKNQTNGKMFERENLILIDSFKAEKGEAYLLDVTKPHSVESEVASDRFALCVQTNKFTFDEVKEMLYESGQL